MDVKPYVANIKAFVASLPTSGISFLYFQKSDIDDHTFIPRINSSAKEWVLDKAPLYIIQSSEGYCYIYKESSIKYKIHLDKYGYVAAFDPQHSTHGVIAGGSGAIVSDVNWGNHLTVGVSKSFITRKILLVTHTTRYIPNPDNPLESQRQSTKCNVYLESTINESCNCIQDGMADGTRLDLYNKRDADIVPIIKAIHHYIWNGFVKGGKKSRPKVLIGPKGGKYKMVKGRRVYIGGSGDFKDPSSGGFLPSFVAFVKEVVLNAVSSYRPELSEAIATDDGNEHFMVRYIFKAIGFDTSHLFMIDRGMVLAAWRAHTKAPEARSQVESQALQTFVAFVDGFRAIILSVAA